VASRFVLTTSQQRSRGCARPSQRAVAMASRASHRSRRIVQGVIVDADTDSIAKHNEAMQTRCCSKPTIIPKPGKARGARIVCVWKGHSYPLQQRPRSWSDLDHGDPGCVACQPHTAVDLRDASAHRPDATGLPLCGGRPQTRHRSGGASSRPCRARQLGLHPRSYPSFG
jgi:hypothetical protein